MCENLHYESVYFKELHNHDTIDGQYAEQGELYCQQLLVGINIMLAGNAKSFKSFQNSSHIIYSRPIRDSVKAVKTVMRPSAGACTK